MNNPVYAVVFVTKAHGFHHINTRLNQAYPEDMKNVREGNLPYSLFNDHYSNVAFNIQYNLDRSGDGYGHKPVLNDVHNLDLQDAEKSLKVLRKVTKAYDKMGNENNAVSALINFLFAAKVQRVYIRYMDTVGFDSLSMVDAIYQLKQIDEDFKKVGENA